MMRTGALLRSFYIPMPWRTLFKFDESGILSTPNNNEFSVNLDVQQFKPEELKVQVDDGYVVIQGEHEEKSDKHGFISRKFIRRYRVPAGVEIQKLRSTLYSDGILSLVAPLKAQEDTEKPQEIPITFTNTPAAITSLEEEQKKTENKDKNDKPKK